MIPNPPTASFAKNRKPSAQASPQTLGPLNSLLTVQSHPDPKPAEPRSRGSGTPDYSSQKFWSRGRGGPIKRTATLARFCLSYFGESSPAAPNSQHIQTLDSLDTEPRSRIQRLVGFRPRHGHMNLRPSQGDSHTGYPWMTQTHTRRHTVEIIGKCSCVLLRISPWNILPKTTPFP